MSTTINLTNVTAAKGYGGADLVAIYGQGGVKIWEAEEHDYSLDYLTFVARNEGAFNYQSEKLNKISYSTDNGLTWSEPSENITVNVNTGDKVLWKGTGTISTGYYKPIGTFSNTSTTTFDIKGNIMSLLYGDDFVNKTNLQYTHIFYTLFKETKCVNANNLILPATGLTERCYGNMFNNCTVLTKAPTALPATTLSGACYQNMFAGCTSLISAPTALPGAQLVESCYYSMFQNCTSLTTPPEIQATSINGSHSCRFMFSGCTSLTSVPHLPANTGGNCYNQMFNNCTSLTTSPKLTATTLSGTCYSEMFKGSTNLNYITMLATDISADRCLNNWVQNVAATGIFVKNIDATWTTTGDSGVPTGWTVIYYDSSTDRYYLSDKVTMCDDHGNPIGKDYSRVPFTIVAKSDGDIDMNRGSYQMTGGSGSGSGSGDGEGGGEKFYEIEYSTDGGTTWETAEGTVNPFLTFTVQAGDEIMLRYDMTPLIDDPDIVIIDNMILQTINSSDVDFEVKGNIMSLLYGDDFIGKTSLIYNNSEFCFEQMFFGSEALTNAENLILPATTLTNACYRDMFRSCTSLTTAPELPATTLTQNCYTDMFSGCTSLTHITMLATDISAQQCLNNWVDGVAATGTFVKAASMNSLPTGASGIPSGWNIQDAN